MRRAVSPNLFFLWSLYQHVFYSQTTSFCLCRALKNDYTRHTRHVFSTPCLMFRLLMRFQFLPLPKLRVVYLHWHSTIHLLLSYLVDVVEILLLHFENPMFRFRVVHHLDRHV